MPDFNIEIYFHCTTQEHWSTKVKGSTGKEYTVIYGHAGYGYDNFDYTCTCDAFKFNKYEHCKHIKQVKESGLHCNWDGFLTGEKPVKKDGGYYCPRCGAPAIPLRHAV